MNHCRNLAMMLRNFAASKTNDRQKLTFNPKNFQSMTKFSKISAEAQSIVNFFILEMIKKTVFCEPYKVIIVSLYAMRNDADKNLEYIGVLQYSSY